MPLSVIQLYAVCFFCFYHIFYDSMVVKDLALIDSDLVEASGELLNLGMYPPILRKVAKYILARPGLKEPMTVTCEVLNLNYGSVMAAMLKNRAAGKGDFWRFMERVSDTYLHTSLIGVDSATVEQALTGSNKDRELYYKRTNRLKETPQVQISNNLSLTYAIQVVQPVEPAKQPAKGVNDLTPYIPKT